ncbi:hypothetical protein GAYE_SCF63G6624 [Galdieria yellowstonensis]|uniref:AAA+ ATPase domain-containing protein n=1 Tax=Galdieria yellowstonensis TaxID=3028027 RepID=A0AAV9IMU4_9RHOD|nr:hypothetical protein GAYE_SCF63G6624 [Galdieria yellowstonensis]
MDSPSSREERACGKHMEWEQVFDPGTMKIDRKYANVWLENVPSLDVECSETKVSDYLGETFKVGDEEFFRRDASLEVASSILLPKKFGEDFPLESSGSKISRVFLRPDLIDLWNGLVDERNMRRLNIFSAASGLGKTIYLYLIAVFARYFEIPVQYIGNTRDLLGQEGDDRSVARNYVGNTDRCSTKGPFYSGRPRYNFLQGDAIKFVAYYAFVKGDLVLCDELRRNFMNMKPRNLLIVDEHNAFWQKFGSDPNTWLPFFKFYADPVAHVTRDCKFVIAGSQHHEFESNLHSGYEFSVQYVEPLSLEEFAIWENLRDYPPNSKDKRNEVADLTGLVPRMISMVVDFANTSGGMSFEDLFSKLRDTVSGAMETKHDEYVEALNKRKKEKFMKMLHNLFLGSETPRIRISDAAYRDRGLLIALNDGRLQFYNSVARDILFGTFSRYYFTKDRIVELSQKFKDSRGSGDSGGKYFEELFFVWCQCEYLQITLSSQLYNRTIRFTSNVWFRFDGKRIYPPRSTFDISCWIRFSENYPRLDYAYVDIIGDRWILYLIQASVSSFPVHNRDSAQLELLLTKSETCQLESLLKFIL